MRNLKVSSVAVVAILVLSFAQWKIGTFHPTTSGCTSGLEVQLVAKKTRGDNWELWDRSSVLYKDMGYECRWANYTPPNFPEKMKAMCVHSQSDVVSNQIYDYGYWDDCGYLPGMQDPLNPNRYHLEVGANIGACVILILLTTQAKVIAFEPVPKNLFCLTSTLMRLDGALRDRVTLFPLGLGNIPGTFNIFSAKDNFGNSVIGQKILDVEGQAFEDPVPIRVERADDLLDFSPHLKNTNNFPDIVMKIDAQGFECNVMRGMMETCKKYVRKVLFEVYEHWLNSIEGCSKEILVDLMMEAGLVIFSHPGLGSFLDPRGGFPGDVFAEKTQGWEIHE